MTKSERDRLVEEIGNQLALVLQYPGNAHREALKIEAILRADTAPAGEKMLQNLETLDHRWINNDAWIRYTDVTALIRQQLGYVQKTPESIHVSAMCTNNEHIAPAGDDVVKLVASAIKQMLLSDVWSTEPLMEACAKAAIAAYEHARKGV